ncbi:MAG: DUF6178 family protein [bacterium]|nr:DUF6178 family protein [bacterium]
MTEIIRKAGDEQYLPSVNELITAKDNSGVEKFNALTLQQQLEMVLGSSGRERVELMYLSDRFKSLVGAMPAPEILFTFEEVGMDVALPIIAATNHDQFTFLTDMLCWQKEEVSPEAIIEWLAILVECGEEKVQQWLAKVEPEWFILILKNLVTIYKCDEEGEPPDIPDADYLYTIDGMYYFDFLDSHAIDPLQTILSIFRDEDPDGFRGIMEAAIWTDIRETELYAAHFRQSRLSEWGFPELDEAMSIYQYFNPAERKTVVQELENGLSEWTDLSEASSYPIKLNEQQGFLAACIKLVDDGKRMARFSQELVLLANKVQVADEMAKIGALENIRLASKKAMGYVTLGLAGLSNVDPLKASELIGRVHTERLFQVGFSQVQDLKRAARKIARKLSLKKHPERMNQIPSPDREILKGLLKRQSKYFVHDQPAPKVGYIDFHEPEQIKNCWRALKNIAKIEFAKP